MNDDKPHQAVRRVEAGDRLRLRIVTDDGARVVTDDGDDTIERVVERVEDDPELASILEQPREVYLGGESAALRLLTFRTVDPRNPVYVSRDDTPGTVGREWTDYGHVVAAESVACGSREQVVADGGEP